jgi:YVTN family beta-propeller protein
MKTLKLTTTLLLTLFILNSCSNNDDPKLPLGDYENGYFIVNEGPFQNGSGTITFVGDDGVVSQNIFKTVNNEDLGNIVNSMTLGINNAYIVVNNSNKIIVANKYTMEKIATIDGNNIKNPRQFVIQGDTGYVTNWGDPLNPSDDFIALIDLSTNTVFNTISVGEGPEDMIISNSKIYVNLQGGFNFNNKVVIIDTNSNTVENTIVVGDVPNSLIDDGSGNIWVLCEGIPEWTGNETAGSLYKINTGNLNISNFNFELTDHPSLLNYESSNLYFSLNGKIFGMNINSNEIPNESINGLDGFYYSMKVSNNELFAADAKDFSSEGTLKIFNIVSGALLETVTTGIIPGDIVFQN